MLVSTLNVVRRTSANDHLGAIRLTLKVAQEVDRGNKALSWVRERSDPSTDPNDVRRDYYERRASCYTLVCRVIEAVDQAYNNQGPVQEGVTSQITRRKHEAYEQINTSDDEVFQNYLYDWYMSRGWADRLLEINSPFVIDYLRQSAETDLAHADLLWRYFAHYNDYLSAAETQYQLAKSTLPLTLERRIEYLSRAKANASTRMTGFSETGVRNRQSRQELLRNISDHLDIANIQDDVLQKIRADIRLTGERRQEVIEHLNGQIHPLDEVSSLALLSRTSINLTSFTMTTLIKLGTTTSVFSSTMLPIIAMFRTFDIRGAI